MADPPPDTDDTGVGSDRESTTGTPRWVKVFGVIMAVLVPLAFASLLTGIVQSLGTTWGLFRHYWVLFKLLITVFATIVLLIYMETFRYMAGVASDPGADLAVVRNASPALHSALGLVVLLVA